MSIADNVLTFTTVGGSTKTITLPSRTSNIFNISTPQYLSLSGYGSWASITGVTRCDNTGQPIIASDDSYAVRYASYDIKKSQTIYYIPLNSNPDVDDVKRIISNILKVITTGTVTVSGYLPVMYYNKYCLMYHTDNTISFTATVTNGVVEVSSLSIPDRVYAYCSFKPNYLYTYSLGILCTSITLS